MSELSKRIIQVQTELKAPKDQYNDFGKFYYRSAESILETLKPLLAKHELLQVISDEIVLSGDWHYIKATVTVSHGEESLSVSALAREQESKKGMDESQITGTASSYARKYALNGLWAIDDTKDSDTNEYRKQTESKPATGTRKSKPAADPKPKSEPEDFLSYDEVLEIQNQILTAMGHTEGATAWRAMLKMFRVTSDTLKREDKSKYLKFFADWGGESNVNGNDK
ncbi:MAG: ERF family protein [Saccharofermentanales bacterium]|jgi:hypothetical protein|nr:ERF family protein [Clostridiales bacterium]